MNFALALSSSRCAAAAAFLVVVAGTAGCATTTVPHDGNAFAPSAPHAPGASPAADPWYAGGGVKAQKPARDFDYPLFQSAQ